MRKILKKLPLVAFIYHYTLAFLGALYYGFPSRKLHVIGITGTKGKTTTIEILRAIIEASGEKTAALSSLVMVIGDTHSKNRTGNTMPGRFFIQKFLSQAVNAGCRYVFIEVTSEGARYSRHKFIDWDVACLLNLHAEHIESHGSFEKYREAKLSFLRYAGSRGAKIFINGDDANADFYKRSLVAYATTLFLYNKTSAFPFLNAGFDDRHFSEFLSTPFNQSNAAAAVLMCEYLGVSREVIIKTLETFSGILGRMEYVAHDPFSVVVDYAHTPDSLEAIYKSLSEKSDTGVSHSRLLCVLGSSGGGRDAWKRPVMGEIAAQYCSLVVLTDEDPHDENPDTIIDEIEKGVISGARGLSHAPTIIRVNDRREAIQKAIASAEKRDIVIITGKGSEESIHYERGRVVPWSDRAVAEEALENIRA